MSSRPLLIIQIDGLSGHRFEAAVARGLLPSVVDHCHGAPAACVRKTVGLPSTPAFQSALLYGRQHIVHSYSWFDRERGIIRRFDVPEDVAHVEAQLQAGSSRPPLLSRAGTASYFMTFMGGAARALLTLANGLLPSGWFRTSHLITGLGRGLLRAPLELGRGVADLVDFVARHRTTAYELNWLAMRLLHALAFEEISTTSAVADLRGRAPIVYVDFLAYDEAAHRRGPDHPVALEQLRRIDERIARLLEAGHRHGYDIVLCSDHGQAAATPFAVATGKTLASLVFEACAGAPPDRRLVELADTLDQARVRASRVRKWPDPLGKLLAARARATARRAARELEARFRVPAGELAVVTGGSIAHVYVGRLRRGSSLEDIRARFPHLLPALLGSAGVGLVVARSTARGPLVLLGDRQVPLDDVEGLADLEPFRVHGVDALTRLIHLVIDNPTAGDLVLYGAFAPAGAISFEPEHGSHGGIHPDELDVFVIEPDGAPLIGGRPLDPAELGVILRQKYA